MKGIGSADFDKLPCNCSKKCKKDGICAYNNDCRSSMAVYEVNCKVCDKINIGNSQQKIKKRMEKHFNDVKKLVEKGEKSNSFANHFAEHFEPESKVTASMVREITSTRILWQGNPINCMKTFKKLNCTLCSNERMEIVKANMKRTPRD